MSKFALFILILFVAVSVAGFWYWHKNQYSKEILKLEILGPEVVQAGEEADYLVRFKNNGSVRLEDVKFSFEFPDHSLVENHPDLRVTQKLDDIYPGEERVLEFKARLFGKEGDVLTAKASLTYRPKNLKARYESQTSFSTQIKFVPLTLEFDLPLKAEKGEEISFSLNYFSNIEYTLENLRVKIEYPKGFEFGSASPQALDEKEWDIFHLTQADGGRIKIRGKIEGDEGEQKIFKAQVGLIVNSEFWPLKEVARSLEIVEPSLYISQTVNNSLNYTAKTGELLHYKIFFKNIGSKPIQKKFLIVKLDGEFFDLNSLKSEKGEYSAGDNTLIFDWKNIPSLRFLDAEEEGEVEFWVRVKDKEKIREKIKNPVLRDAVSVGGVEKSFETKINSEIELSQKVYFQQEEFFGNSGPLPPKVGETTTYTVVWQLKNYWNDLKNVKARMRLPKNVRLTGKMFPEDAKITFDSASKEVVWTVEEVEAFKGVEDIPLTVAFQIEFIPDASQRYKTALLVNKAEVVGEDTWTEQEIKGEAPEVDTTLPDEEGVGESQGIVE